MTEKLTRIFAEKYGLGENDAENLSRELLSSEYTCIHDAAAHLAETGKEVELLNLCNPEAAIFLMSFLGRVGDMAYPEKLLLSEDLLNDLHFLAELEMPITIHRRDGDTVVMTGRIFDKTGADVTEERNRALRENVFAGIEEALQGIEADEHILERE